MEKRTDKNWKPMGEPRDIPGVRVIEGAVAYLVQEQDMSRMIDGVLEIRIEERHMGKLYIDSLSREDYATWTLLAPLMHIAQVAQNAIELVLRNRKPK